MAGGWWLVISMLGHFLLHTKMCCACNKLFFVGAGLTILFAGKICASFSFLFSFDFHI